MLCRPGSVAEGEQFLDRSKTLNKPVNHPFTSRTTLKPPKESTVPESRSSASAGTAEIRWSEFPRAGVQGENGAPVSQDTKRSSRIAEEPLLSQPFQRIEVATGREGETHVRVCQEMAMGEVVPSPDEILSATNHGRDVVEYHNNLNLLSILSEVVSQDRRRQLTRIVVDDKVVYTGVIAPPQPLSYGQAELSGLDAASKEYLIKKGAFEFPPKSCM